MAKQKKILIVDDSAFMRRVLSDIIGSDDRCTVVGTAPNGKEGLEKVKTLDPDVITLDVEMPIMDGLTMLENLMKIKFKPVILLSSLAKKGAETTLKALDLGAVDFICKPQNIFKVNSDEMRKDIIDKIITASEIRRPLKNITAVPKPKFSPKYTPFVPSTTANQKENIIKPTGTIPMKKVVALGISTGGPRALQEVIPFIPANIAAGIVIVQHMPPGFTKSLADRLNNLSQINVKEAENGDIIKSGWAYVAPGDFQLLIEKKGSNLCIKLSSGPPVGGHKPAANVMMNSLSKTNYKNVISVIMTGMGCDGCEGIKNLKQNNNAYTIAQNEASCVVYGMPKAVVEAGFADKVLPLNEIAKEITKVVEEN